MIHQIESHTMAIDLSTIKLVRVVARGEERIFVEDSRKASILIERFDEEDMWLGYPDMASADTTYQGLINAWLRSKLDPEMLEFIGEPESSCIWEDCDQPALYCEDHARELVDPLGQLKRRDTY